MRERRDARPLHRLAEAMRRIDPLRLGARLSIGPADGGGTEVVLRVSVEAR